MSDIITKCRELAAEIENSDEYKRVKAAEDAVSKDQEALALIFEYRRGYEKMTSLFGHEDDDNFGDIAKNFAETESKMKENAVVYEMMMAQSEFAKILNQVNFILDHVINPVTADLSSSGCTGNCATCGKCD